MTLTETVATLTLPTLLALAAGCALLRRAFARETVLPEEIALAGAWVFVGGSLVWLGAFLSESAILGFAAPWTWITSAHFAFAGYGALTVTALSCRVVSSPLALRILRILLVAHPVAYLVIAAGILGYRFCDELGASVYVLIFVSQLAAVLFGRPRRIAAMPLIILRIALAVPLATLVPAVAWAWAVPILDLTGMVRYHGVVNAFGHVGLGLFALAWSRVPSHSALRKAVHPAS